MFINYGNLRVNLPEQDPLYLWQHRECQNEKGLAQSDQPIMADKNFNDNVERVAKTREGQK